MRSLPGSGFTRSCWCETHAKACSRMAGAPITLGAVTLERTACGRRGAGPLAHGFAGRLRSGASGGSDRAPTSPEITVPATTRWPVRSIDVVAPSASRCVLDDSPGSDGGRCPPTIVAASASSAPTGRRRCSTWPPSFDDLAVEEALDPPAADDGCDRLVSSDLLADARWRRGGTGHRALRRALENRGPGAAATESLLEDKMVRLLRHGGAASAGPPVPGRAMSGSTSPTRRSGWGSK